MKLQDVERQLFFIVGCPRSGTTLTQLLISSHPKVGIPPETGFYPIHYRKYVGELGEISDPEHFNEALRSVFEHYRIKDLDLDFQSVRQRCKSRNYSWETIFLAILAEYAEKAGVSRVGEKSPAHLHFLGLLQQRFPEAKFIHVVRDPRAVALSLSRVSWGTTDIKSAAAKWKKAIDIHLKSSGLIGESKYLAIRYEDLVSSTEPTLRKISKFLGIDFDPRMLEHHQREQLGFNKRYIRHMSSTLKPVFTEQVDAWKQDLPPWKIKILQSKLSREMALFGYDPIQVKAPISDFQYLVGKAIGDIKKKVFKSARRCSRLLNGILSSVPSQK